MKSSAVLILGIAATVTLSAGTAWLVVRHEHEESRRHASDSGTEDFHSWMHRNLDISPEQHARMEAAETRYETERMRLRTEISAAGKDLAEAIRTASADSAIVQTQLTRLNKAQGELQQVTLAHFFSMKDHLRPEQAEKLLKWTHDSITRGHLD